MPRHWFIAIPGLAFALALTGCAICSDTQPMSEVSAAPTGAPPSPPEQREQPERHDAVLACQAGGFAPGSAHLNNADKACLDDVAQRLKADPRAHVVVVGYAEGDENDADAIASRRADAVRDYLVKGGGIDGGRIRVRSAGVGRPGGGASDSQVQGNRLCEVWFVPEGASDPS